MRLLKIIPNANVSSYNAILGSNLRNDTKLEKYHCLGEESTKQLGFGSTDP